MKIGFDAKRAFHNTTGLGNYSRTLINSLTSLYPQHDYFLFNTKPSSLYQNKHAREIVPQSTLSKLLPSIWRSKWILNDLEKLNIDLYHGLSHEIPLDIHKTNVKSIVTIHDLIPERYPQQYKKIDVQIYHKKFLYACKYADKVIAISEQTRRDIIDFYKTPEEKITVCYQSCHPSFAEEVDEATKQLVASKYSLPSSYYLSVGSIIERKNLLSVCKAMSLSNNNIPLVIIGDGGAYKVVVKEFITANKLTNRVIFLSDALPKPAFEDLPAIYQSATAMIYPSTFEGFGLPVLEALFSRLPVITSNVSCLPEAGGDAALYVDPLSPEQIAEAMNKIAYDIPLVASMKEKGWLHAQKFTAEKCAASVMKVYQSIW